MKEGKLEVVRQESPAAPALSFVGVNIEALMEKAIDAKSAVEVLERLMAMRREAKAESAKEAFDHALAAFQAECPVVSKGERVMDRKNPGQVRYRYAPLDSIVGQVKETLAKHGFSYTLTALVDDKWVTAILTAKHRDGHSEKTEFKVPVDFDSYMNKAQQFASALTFAKRYAFCNGFGILTGDYDDDAQATDRDSAAGQDRRPASARPQLKPQAAPRAQTPPQAAAAPAKPASVAKKVPTEEDKAALPALASELRKLLGSPGYELHVVRYLQEVKSAQGNYLLMGNEGLEDLTVTQLRTLITHWDRAQPAIDLWLHDNPEPAQAPAAAGPGAAGEWEAVVVPIPRKGQKRDDYMANPDTLGSLYASAKTDEEARRRLFGLANNFEPSKTWTNRDGKAVERAEEEYNAELDFRDGLDAFLAWHDSQSKSSEL